MPSPTLITGGAPALPGTCYLCNSSNRERFIDWGIQIEFHGAFYVCDLCLIEAAQVLGLATQAQVEKLKAEKASAVATSDQLHEEVKALKELRHGLDSVMGYLGDDSNSPGFDFEYSDSDSEQVEEGSGELESGKSGPAESSNDEELGELRPSQLISPKRSSS